VFKHVSKFCTCELLQDFGHSCLETVGQLCDRQLSVWLDLYAHIFSLGLTGRINLIQVISAHDLIKHSAFLWRHNATAVVCTVCRWFVHLNRVTGSIQWVNYCSWLLDAQSLLILLSTTVSCCQSRLVNTLCSRKNSIDFQCIITCLLPRAHVRTGASDIADVANFAEFNAVVWPRPTSVHEAPLSREAYSFIGCSKPSGTDACSSYPSFSHGLEFPPLTTRSLHSPLQWFPSPRRKKILFL